MLGHVANRDRGGFRGRLSLGTDEPISARFVDEFGANLAGPGKFEQNNLWQVHSFFLLCKPNYEVYDGN